jgi:beta-glucosidase-like glycosyl hydrolase
MNGPNDALPADIKFQLVRKLERHKVIGLAGAELLEHEAKYIEFHRLSGVILFERNIESLTQVADLIGAVHERLSDDGLPALVMADHEGDYVSVLKKLIGVPPSAMAIAAAGDAGLARDVARETGAALAKLGVNVVLAPVADCYLNTASPVTGLRTFGADPERVAEFVQATIEGFHAAGIAACVKHFPGHGDSGDDSHATLPGIRKSIDDLWAADLVPFDHAVKSGVDMVMTGHVAYSLDDPEPDGTPASFDARLIRGILRETLGFGGVVITDALEMAGAKQHARSRYGGLAGGFERAILAGSDLLMYSSPVPERVALQDDSEPMIAVEVMQTIIETLNRVVDRSRIDAKLEEAAKENEGIRNLLGILDASHERIAALRVRCAQVAGPQVPRREGNVIHLGAYASTPPIYKDVAARSLAVLRDPEGFVPVQQDSAWTVLPVLFRYAASLHDQDLQSFIEALCRQLPRWRVTSPLEGFEEDETGRLSPRLAAPDRKVILDAQRATGADLSGVMSDDEPIIPVVSSRTRLSEDASVSMTRFLEERHIPFVIVTGVPVTDWVPESVGCLVTLGASAATGTAAAAVLSGAARASASLARLLPPPKPD